MAKKVRLIVLLVLIAGAAVWALSGQRHQTGNFVGKWQSSRTNTPIHLDANGEWEIRADDGKALQYGLWRYEGDKLIWTIKQDGQVIDDVNPVLSVSAKEFQIRERTGETTVFRRLE